MEIDDYTHPPDPFKVLWVDPDQIQRHTNREYPAWWPDCNRMRLFGRVQGGEWDQPSEDYPQPPKVEDRIDYKSFKSHFVDDIPWSETEYINTIVERTNNDKIKLERLLDRYSEYDDLYNNIRKGGYLSQKELVEEGVEEKTFEQAIKAEIAVDIGRSGELLFVDGSHRLIMSKLLGIEQIPIVVYFRHKKWMEYRDNIAESGNIPDHPDFRDLK